jgi:TPR repeat protein|tara:strand:- start:4125 stop:4802 length:678 start_codon:yes stop_codon:yes gene_type:complete
MDVSVSLVNARDKYFEGKYAEAIAIWDNLSKKGVSEAKAWLGSCYANGDGVGLNDAVALKYFEEAANAGNALAQANAGAFHFMGRGTKKDPQEAIKWLQKASDNNDLNGLFNLAQILFQGSDVEQDYKRAAALYQKAAELGHYPSQARLGQMYINGQGVEKSRIHAYLWLSLASQHGIGTALEALNGMVADMSAEEKAEGVNLFNTWRAKTISEAPQVAIVPAPS